MMNFMLAFLILSKYNFNLSSHYIGFPKKDKKKVKGTSNIVKKRSSNTNYTCANGTIQNMDPMKWSTYLLFHLITSHLLVLMTMIVHWMKHPFLNLQHQKLIHLLLNLLSRKLIPRYWPKMYDLLFVLLINNMNQCIRCCIN